jgi:lysophospholipase L1-like esterase
MRRPLRNKLRTIFYNLLVLFVLSNVLYWSIPTINFISTTLARKSGGGQTEFRSFIGWRHLPMERPGIHIGGHPYPQRRTVNVNVGTKKVYFFGGSTMWGFGVADSETIPSLFASATGLHSENYAEIGYTSHQSLVLLLQLLQAGHQPALVVFYDGANDVAIKCENGLRPDSHGQEREMNSLLQGHDRPSTFKYYFRPVARLADKFGKETNKAIGGSRYDCDSDRAKSEAIAGNLMQDWQFAKLLAEQFGSKFLGILQPVIYFSDTRKDHLTLPPRLDRQYEAIYPLMRKQMSGRAELHDFGSVLDVDERIYSDFNHVVPKGNQLIAKKIADVVASAGLSR